MPHAMRLGRLLLVLHVLVCWHAHGGDAYSFRPYHAPPSISDDRISDLYEAGDGTLWVGVWGGGVCRVRGAETRTFTKADGLPSDWVRCLAMDTEGNVWIGTADGITRISADNLTTFTTDNTPEMPQNSVRCVTLVSSGTLCFGMSNGGILCRGPSPFSAAVVTPDAAADSEWFFDDRPELMEGRGVRDILETSDKSLWIALHDGSVTQYAGGAWRHYGPGEGITEGVFRLFEDSSGTMWGSGGKFLYRFDGTEWKAVPEAGNVPNAVAESPHGELFVGTRNGIVVSRPSGWSSLSMGAEVGSPEITCLLFGRTGAPWVGTLEGVIRGSRPLWNPFVTTESGIPLREGILFADTNPYSVDVEGNIVAFDGMAWKSIAHVDDPRFTPLYITPPREGNVWALCEQFALRIAVNSWTVQEAVTVSEDLNPWRLAWGLEGNLWLLGSRGAYELKEGQWSPLPTHPETKPSWAYDVDIAADGSVYVCYAGGVEYWENGRIQAMREVDPAFRDGHYASVCRMKDGSLWVGTYGTGILVYSGHDVTQITRQDGLLSDHVSDITQAPDGTIWVAFRRKGVASFRNGKWVNFGHRHGLPNASPTCLAALPDNSLWLATSSQGCCRYFPDSEGPETTIVAATDTIAARGTGVFSFSGVDSWQRTLPQDLTYSWRMRPTVQPASAAGWSDFSHNTTAVVSGLAAGNYVFEVRTMDEDRNVDATASLIPVIIEPPFWGRPGFVVPLGAFAALALLSLVFVYSKHLRLVYSEANLRRSEKSLAEAQRIAHVGSWEWDVASNTILCSPESFRLLGIAPVPKGISMEQYREAVHPEDRALFQAAVQSAISQWAPLEIDHRILRPHGEVRHVYQRGEVIEVPGTHQIRLVAISHDITERKRSEALREQLIRDLQSALARIKTLSGLIPICSSCKRIRDDSGFWNQIESYIKEHSDAEFSHGICPECAKKLYGVEDLMRDA
ncbi:MAG: PAS domain-containing protein [Candidatus Hydrogenedentes bacterium]|nr:PAS domain-containing protein [Candidatus Hydrogenedentota bacterium]